MSGSKSTSPAHCDQKTVRRLSPEMMLRHRLSSVSDDREKTRLKVELKKIRNQKLNTVK
jgi:hypothetical protein